MPQRRPVDRDDLERALKEIVIESWVEPPSLNVWLVDFDGIDGRVAHRPNLLRERSSRLISGGDTR